MTAPTTDHTRLAALAVEAAGRLEGAHPLSVLEWAAERFADSFCIASSMQDAVLPHLAGRVLPGVPVVFLDTGYHFAETIGTRDAVAATMPIDVLTIQPRQTVAEQDAAYGPRLYERDPDRCCALRKVGPLARVLAPYAAWASGLRRDEAPSRRNAPVVGWDDRHGMVKVNPLACWTQADVDAYSAEHGVLVNPLAFDGYPSIGCAPCTRRVTPGGDPRAGRWAGTGKSECGIHR